MSNETLKAARWLLNHFGCSPDNDAVIGDLDERHTNGHSTGWYWRQVLIALVVGFFHELNIHRSVAIRAVIRGWWLLLLSSTGIAAVFWLGEWKSVLQSRTGQIPAKGWAAYLTTAWGMWTYALAGFVVARCNREHRVFAVVCFSMTVPLLVFASSTSPWSTEIATMVIAQLLVLLGGGIFTETTTRREDSNPR